MKKMFLLGFLFIMVSATRGFSQNQNDPVGNNPNEPEIENEAHHDMQQDQVDFNDDEHDAIIDKQDLDEDHDEMLNEQEDFNDDHQDITSDENDFSNDQGEDLDEQGENSNEQGDIDTEGPEIGVSHDGPDGG